MNQIALLFRSTLEPTAKVNYRNVAHVAGGNSTARFNNRLYALDLARFLAMVFMMQGHVLDALVNSTIIDINIFPWNVWNLSRGFTAPIFLMVSGAVHAFATKRDQNGNVRADIVAKRIRWGLTIIGIGYLLVFPAGRVWDLPFLSSGGWNAFFAVNILQLTGVTILLFIVTMSSTTSVKSMGVRALVIAALIVATTPIVQLTQVVSGLPGWFRAYFTSAEGSIFPVFPFSAYLFLGLAIGCWLHNVPMENRDAMLKKFGWRVGGVVALFAVVLQGTLLVSGVSNEIMEHQMSIILFLRRAGIVMVFFSICVIVLERTYQFRKWYSLFGTKSLYIYAIHLILLFGTPWIEGIGRTHYHSLSLSEGIAVAIGIVFITLAVAWLIDWYTRQSWALRARTALVYVGTTTLAYLLIL
ncbi:MAG: acyltransferase [Ignavibacteria bacterium]|nr:acyltransferase [Ignavibacteria bacterium]